MAERESLDDGTWREDLGTWRKHLVETYHYGPTTILAIAGLIAIFGAFFAKPGWQAVLVNIGTALLLIPPIVVTERLVLSGEVKEVRASVNKQLAELRQISAQHDVARENLPPSGKRTRRFQQFFEEVEERVKDTDMDEEQARDLFKLPYGDRLIVLASAQVNANHKLFPQVIEAIEHSITAYEQARALDAAAVMLPKLSEAQKQQLVKVIDENPWIRPGTYRWDVRGEIFEELGH